MPLLIHPCYLLRRNGRVGGGGGGSGAWVQGFAREGSSSEGVVLRCTLYEAQRVIFFCTMLLCCLLYESTSHLLHDDWNMYSTGSQQVLLPFNNKMLYVCMYVCARYICSMYVCMCVCVKCMN